MTTPREDGSVMRLLAGHIKKLAKRAQRYNEAAQNANLHGDRVKVAYLLGKQSASQALQVELLSLMEQGALSAAQDAMIDERAARMPRKVAP